MKYKTIQLLRYFSALLVVFTHSTFYINSRMNVDFPIMNFGAQGVNIFFVISGFVMISSSKALTDERQAFSEFFLSRLIRIVPLYWALNFLKISMYFLIPGVLFAQPTVTNVISSLLFLPSKNANGMVEAFYGVGWTLNFEMAFYLLFGTTMLFFRRHYLYLMMGVLIAAAIISKFVSKEQIALFTLLNPIVLNFLWGIVIGCLLHKKIEIPTVISISMIGFGLFDLFYVFDFYLFELEYAFLVGGFVFLENKKSILIPYHFVRGGDFSYSLYLIHPMIGVLVTVILVKLGITIPLVALPLIMLACIFGGFVTHEWVEKPITSRLRAKFLSGRSAKLELKN